MKSFFQNPFIQLLLGAAGAAGAAFIAPGNVNPVLAAAVGSAVTNLAGLYTEKPAKKKKAAK